MRPHSTYPDCRRQSMPTPCSRTVKKYPWQRQRRQAAGISRAGRPRSVRFLCRSLRSFDVTRSRVHGRPESHAVFCLNKVKTQNTSATTGSQGMLDLGVTRRWCSRCVGRLRMRGRVAPICGLVPRAQVRAELPRAVARREQRRGHHARRAHLG